MASPAKTAANRRNASKSTGPKTLAGKQTSALNAIRHAALSVVPVLPGVERIEDWEAHRSATLASLAPFGYLETVLADRVASLLWRLGRVTRYETENTASELETAEEELSESLLFRSSFGRGRAVLGTTPEKIREELEIRIETAKGFLYLRESGEDEAFPSERAELALLDIARHAGVELADVSLPFLPAEADELGWGEWSGWTKAIVVQVVAAIVAASERAHVRDSGADEAWRTCGMLAEANAREAARALREVEGKLQRSVRSRVLLSAEGLEKVARYETHLERSFYKALHELQRLQAARDGTGGPPMAFDVDVSVGPRLRGFVSQEAAKPEAT